MCYDLTPRSVLQFKLSPRLLFSYLFGEDMYNCNKRIVIVSQCIACYIAYLRRAAPESFGVGCALAV